MKDVIGVLHVNRNLEHLVRFIDGRYGTPDSLMLELPSDWRDDKDRVYAPKYFYELAKRYEERGTKIIAGDKKRDVVEPQHPQWFLDFEERLRNDKWNPKTYREWAKGFLRLTSECLRYFSLLAWNLLSPTKHRIRNEGFLEAYDESQPDLTVVGCVHGKFLKNHRPDTNYIFFMGNSLIENLALPVHYYLLRSARADSYAVLPPSRS